MEGTMQSFHCLKASVVLITLTTVAACATTADLIKSPTVNLTGVELTKLGFSKQTFMLEFDVSNPNPFALPVQSLDYAVSLDGTRFAGGKTGAAFTVPARGDNRFAISVDLDALTTATQIRALLKDGMPDDVPYALDGSFTVDLPFARPIPFSASGVVELSGTGL